ncbi:MAG: hypothetical protein EBR02_07845 [Alphaproteobacteria bacterium]|nr:hypothetical protein [Alphaproteobacteria bacterium]
MNIYTYPNSSIVREVSFVKSDGGSLRAYLTAAEGADPKLLYAAMCHLADEGLQCIPSFENGRPVLEVRGIGKEQSLLKLLEEKGSVVGAPRVIKELGEKTGFMDKVKKRSLLASGMTFLGGDVCFAMYGYKDSSKLDIAAAMAYALGTASTLILARKDQSDLQIKDISKKMAAYMRSQQTGIPNDCAVNSIIAEHNKSTLKKTDDYLRQYPSEMFNMFTGLAGALIAIAAYKGKVLGKPTANAFKEAAEKLVGRGSTLTGHALQEAAQAKAISAMRKEGWGDVGLGLMTTASGAFGALVTEKAHDPDAPKKTGVAAMWQWMQEHPLSIAGGGYLVSTMCHAWSTGVAWKSGDSERRKAVKWRVGFIVTNVIAEILLAISSKGHGDGVVSDRSVDDSVIALAADLIIQQPKKLQPTLIDQVADFLGQPNILALKDRDVRKELEDRVAQMRENPWAKAQGQAIKASTAPIEKRTETDPEKMHIWQEKVAKAASITPSPLIH